MNVDSRMTSFLVIVVDLAVGKQTCALVIICSRDHLGVVIQHIEIRRLVAVPTVPVVWLMVPRPVKLWT